jgi:hypothetical protein
MNPLIQSKKSTPLFVIAVLLACFALLPTVQAIMPPPDGGYPNGVTAEGEDALFNLSPSPFFSQDSTAIGFHALFSSVSSFFDTAVGSQALASSTGGEANTAVGYKALTGNTGGAFNTAVGQQALASNTTAFANTAIGTGALFRNTTGEENTASGADALGNNTTGLFNTATGTSALFSNTIGFDNTSTGARALESNTTGNNNTATGARALLSNTTGSDNTANGLQALGFNTTGHENTAIGTGALNGNITGSFNTAVGVSALVDNTTGHENTAIGVSALLINEIGSFNTAIGEFALKSLTTGDHNIALGFRAGINLDSGDNNIYIGNAGFGSEFNRIRIGANGTHNATFIAGISGVAVTGSQVIVNSNGRLGVTASSARFKEAIRPMDKASEAILALKPVAFRYKKEIDPAGTSQFGLVAEDVEKVNPDLVIRDPDGKAYTVRYEAVNAMLLNEFLKEHRKVQQQEATITQLKKDLQATAAHQQKQIEALTAGLQRVSAQLELSKPAPQTVLNNQ